MDWCRLTTVTSTAQQLYDDVEVTHSQLLGCSVPGLTFVFYRKTKLARGLGSTRRGEQPQSRLFVAHPARRYLAIRQLVAVAAALAISMLLVGVSSAQSVAERPPPLRLETKIPLGDIRGRLDHLAVDLARKRLFVAELANDSVGVIDLGARQLHHRIRGVRQPQGVGYVPITDTLYVASGGDGSVHLFRGQDFGPSGTIELGSDADNIRVDTQSTSVLVGYGKGSIVALDAITRTKQTTIQLSAHPEGFQLERGANQIFANIPNAQAIAVIDRGTHQQTDVWSTGDRRGNFAMALDEANQRVIAIFRDPPSLTVLAMKDGTLLAERDACGDADDVFIDANRKRIYVICGEGGIDVFEASPSYRRLARIATISGARTGLFIPQLDRLALAVPPSTCEAAGVWLYQTSP